MHRLSYNELRLDLAIQTVSPLCIQNSEVPPRFVRGAHPESGTPSAYIPAGTLKGTLRAASERVLQSAGLDCCDSEHPCAERENVKRAVSTPALYRALCSACRIFGSPVMRGHLIVTDFFPSHPTPSAVLRNIPAAEVVEDETFYGTLSLRNFERWQVGLLSLMMSRLKLAEVQIGAYRSEGMGCVVAIYTCLTLHYPALPADTRQKDALLTKLHGVGQFAGEKNPYGYVYPDINSFPDLPDSALYDVTVGYPMVMVADDDEGESHALIENVLTRQALAWGSYVRAMK